MSSASTVEPRKSRRTRVFKGGTIAYSGRQITSPCVVRNISQTGALIQSANAALIPDSFDLIIDLDGLDVECEVAWRLGTKVGVQFIGTPNYQTPARAQVIEVSEIQSANSLRRQKTRMETTSVCATSIDPKEINEQAQLSQKPIHVLIAEDDLDDRYFISEAFEECNVPHTIHFAENGEDVLRYLFALDEFENRLQPDLIILDLNMPKIDGRAALSEIKSYKETRAIPVVVLTTSSYDDDIMSTYDLGVSSYITKPPGLKEFKGIVQELLSYWSNSATRRPIFA